MNKISIEELVVKLRESFEERTARKTSYSRRAFAQHLGVNPSTIQKVLKGERQLGPLIAEKIAQKMGYVLVRPEKKRRRQICENGVANEPAALIILILILNSFRLEASDIEKFLINDLKINRLQMDMAFQASSEWSDIIARRVDWFDKSLYKFWINLKQKRTKV